MRASGIVATVVLLAALPACSGGSSGGNATPKSLADTIGCTSTYIPDTTDEVGVKSVGDCVLNREQVRLLTFADDDARDDFVKVAKGLGIKYVTGPRFAVEVHSAAVESAVKGKL
jgi:hypothetical protein